MARRSDDDQRCRRQLDVLVVDDHRTFADALCIAIGLQGDMSCRAAARSAEAAFADIDVHGCPDVVLLDVELPGMDGIEAVCVFRSRCPTVRVVLVTADTRAQTLIDAVEAGAHGYLPKSYPFAQLLSQLRRLDDELVAEPLSLERALRRVPEVPSPPAEPDPELTEREYQILLLLAEGHAVKQVASRLHMSVHTCRGHVATLLRKFDVHSQLAAVVAAARRGMLPNLVAGPAHAPQD